MPLHESFKTQLIPVIKHQVDRILNLDARPNRPSIGARVSWDKDDNLVIEFETPSGQFPFLNPIPFVHGELMDELDNEIIKFSFNYKRTPSMDKYLLICELG